MILRKEVRTTLALFDASKFGGSRRGSVASVASKEEQVDKFNSVMVDDRIPAHQDLKRSDSNRARTPTSTVSSNTHLPY